MQESAAATKLLASLKSGKQVSTQVVDAYMKKDFNRMISLIEQILGEEPDNKKADVYHTLSNLCYTSKNYLLAKECINKALSFSKQGKFFETLGDILNTTEEYDDAIKAYNMAGEMNKETENIYLKLIKIYRLKANYTSLVDSIWKYVQKYNKPYWAWETTVYLFDQETWHKSLNMKSPGTALCFVLREVMETQKPSVVIEMSERLSVQPFPLFGTPLENAAYSWIRAQCFVKIAAYSKAAEEWYKISQLAGIPDELKRVANAEWRANELAGHFDPLILRNIYTREQTARQGQFMKAIILISDIRGFSRFSYEFRHAPQVILQFLQPNFDASQDIIAKYNGMLDKYLGDGFISFFIPEKQDEEGYYKATLDAMKASIDLQKYFNSQLPNWSDIWKRNLDETTFHQLLVDQVGLGIGIHTGFVFVGEVGTLKRKQYTALGNVVNFTARLQGKAPRDHIVFSAPIYEYIKSLDLEYRVEEMPEEKYSDLKNIPGSYKLYYIKCNS